MCHNKKEVDVPLMPCSILMATRSPVAAWPICLCVGRQPVTTVGMAMKAMDHLRATAVPHRSPIQPSSSEPSGRIKKLHGQGWERGCRVRGVSVDRKLLLVRNWQDRTLG